MKGFESMNIRLRRLRRIAGALAASLAFAASAASPSTDVQELAWRAAQESNQAAAYQAYLAEFPKGKYAPVARVKLAILQDGGATGNPVAPAAKAPAGNTPTAKTPAAKSTFGRPNLPISIPEEVWQVIERSDFVKLMPAAKPLAASYTERVTQHIQGQRQGTRTASQVLIQSSQAESPRSGIVEVRRQNRHSSNVGPDSMDQSRDYYLGGFLHLGGTIEGKEYGAINKLHEFSGSFFPLRTGNEMRIRYDLSGILDRKYDNQCRVGNMAEARSFRPGLRGKAWLITCNYDNTFNGNRKSGITEMHYLEDYGIFTNVFGVTNMSTDTLVFPAQGETYRYEWGERSRHASQAYHTIENYQFPSQETFPQ